MTSNALDDVHCDLSYLLRNLGGNRESARRLVSIYLENHPALMRNLAGAIAERDIEAMLKQIHDIRGGCVLFGAARCIGLVRRLEEGTPPLPRREALAEAHWLAWEADLSALTQALEALAASLRQFMAQEYA